ncbi:glycosyltransferase family 2 protein [Prevotella jejuni]|uniref:glycosyltransferase family 2 protein n=1 Tax=Prevotella jejuni TaxID=1177574 RepID=UPI001BAC8D35|nr:glycosyltransferase family 2 protein [Prevotella jejuni]QUB80812.1 glycosyltransferase family 2 protein [Prevotella jejuni]
MITVFTPTYNRGNLLNRLYQSLCRQNYKEFEWIIVDDGSLDDTSSIVNIIQDKHPCGDFSILYYKKENGGKHTAVNTGVQKAHGDLFFIADSDDILPPNALQTVAEVWEQTKYDNSIGGICGFDGDINDGSLIGTGFPKEVHLLNIELSNHINIGYIDATTRDVRFKLKVDGDMKEVFRTSVLREFPFPEIKGERFCPEVLVWNRIASKYKLRHINKIIYLVEYQKDGITSAITRSRMNSPIASTMTYAEMLDYNISLKWKIRSAINYWRFRYCIKNKALKAPDVKWYWRLFQIIGLLMHLKDSRK